MSKNPNDTRATVPETYATVPAKGEKLADGTWWTHSSATKVGDICAPPYPPYERCECVETAFFGRLPFARWKQLESRVSVQWEQLESWLENSDQ